MERGRARAAAPRRAALGAGARAAAADRTGSGTGGESAAAPPSSLLEAVLLSFVEEVGLRRAQVDDLRAAFSVFFHQGTTFTVVRIRNTLSSANNTPAFIRTVIAFIAHSSE